MGHLLQRRDESEREGDMGQACTGTPVVRLRVYQGRIVGDFAALPPVAAVVVVVVVVAAAAEVEPKVLSSNCSRRQRRCAVALQKFPAAASEVHSIRIPCQNLLYQPVDKHWHRQHVTSERRRL